MTAANLAGEKSSNCWSGVRDWARAITTIWYFFIFTFIIYRMYIYIYICVYIQNVYNNIYYTEHEQKSHVPAQGQEQ